MKDDWSLKDKITKETIDAWELEGIYSEPPVNSDEHVIKKINETIEILRNKVVKLVYKSMMEDENPTWVTDQINKLFGEK